MKFRQDNRFDLYHTISFLCKCMVKCLNLGAIKKDAS